VQAEGQTSPLHFCDLLQYRAQATNSMHKNRAYALALKHMHHPPPEKMHILHLRQKYAEYAPGPGWVIAGLISVRQINAEYDQ
jgi:hypothetical protein